MLAERVTLGSDHVALSAGRLSFFLSALAFSARWLADCHAGRRHSHLFCRPCAPAAQPKARLRAWLQVERGPASEPTEEATVLPVFPLSSIHWPGSEAQLNIIDPAYRKMYDDILLSGSRRFVVPFTRSLPGGRVRYAEMEPEDRRLHDIGSVLYLKDLQEVSDMTGGKVKYVVSHEVLGRARLLRLLNPSALFETDERGNKIDYLRAEVELLSDDSEEAPQAQEQDSSAWREDLIATWSQLQLMAVGADEPRISDQFFVDVAPNVSTWILAAAWQQVQAATRLHRVRARALSDVQEWLKTNRLQEGLSKEELLRNLPPELLQAVSGNADLPTDFWEPLLRVLAADRAQDRGVLLAELAREELQLARARASLRGALDG